MFCLWLFVTGSMLLTQQDGPPEMRGMMPPPLRTHLRLAMVEDVSSERIFQKALTTISRGLEAGR
jgi:hypothetical protein